MKSKMTPAKKRLMVGYASVGVLSASAVTMLIALYFCSAAVWVWGTTGRFSMASLATYWATPRLGDHHELQRATDWLWSSWILVPDALFFLAAFCSWCAFMSFVVKR
jgi:hypothetical protein